MGNSVDLETSMSTADIRWLQRFEHYQKALRQLSQAVAIRQQRQLSELEKQGMIKAFEFTHELAWNVIKDFFEHQGLTGLMGSRDAIREAFRRGLIDDGDGWMEMIRSRNQSAHTYNQDVADEIADKIVRLYHNLFVTLADKLQERADGEQQSN